MLATHPPLSATSNYEKSPPIESPLDLPPPPPPKMLNKLMQRIPVTRKPLPPSKPSLPTNAEAPEQRKDERSEKKADVPVRLGVPSKSRANPSFESMRPEAELWLEAKPDLPPKGPQVLPPRVDSLARVKGASNFPNPKQNLGVAHKKSLSSISQNKELPREPAMPVFIDVPIGFYELAAGPSISGASHCRSQSGPSDMVEEEQTSTMVFLNLQNDL